MLIPRHRKRPGRGGLTTAFIWVARRRGGSVAHDAGVDPRVASTFSVAARYCRDACCDGFLWDVTGDYGVGADGAVVADL